MEIELHFEGQDATDAILEAQDWIRGERIAGLRVERQRAAPREGEMGLELLPILQIIAGSGVVGQLGRSLVGLLKNRPRKLKVTLKLPNNTEFEIDAENLPEDQVVVDRILALISASPG